MRRVALVLVVLGCGAAPTPAVVTTAPPVASTTMPAHVEAPVAESCALGAHRLSTDAPSAWGSTEPSVWLTNREVWYPSGYRGPHRTARLEADGALGNASDVEPFASLGEADNPVVAEGGGVIAYAETVYRAPHDADVVVTLRSGGNWSKPVALMPSPELDDDPAMAFSGGLLAVAWEHGAYPMAPDLALGIVGRDGRVVTTGVVAQDAEAEGIAVVGVPHGWLVIYTPSSALGPTQRGLVALAIDEQGRVASRTVVTKNAALWPVAAWNGHDVGVAFRDETDGQSVGFVRLGPDGHPLGSVVAADKHPNPLAGFRPLSLVPDKDGWWLADVASFHASVMIARASEGRVVELDPDGQPRRAVVVSDREAGASIVRLARRGDRMRGVFVEDRGGQRLRSFTLGCAAAQTPAPADACAARTTSFPPDRYAPFRSFAESAVELGGDLLVGYRPTQQGPYGPAPGNVNVSRMSRDGAVAWKMDSRRDVPPVARRRAWRGRRAPSNGQRRRTIARRARRRARRRPPPARDVAGRRHGMHRADGDRLARRERRALQSQGQPDRDRARGRRHAARAPRFSTSPFRRARCYRPRTAFSSRTRTPGRSARRRGSSRASSTSTAAPTPRGRESAASGSRPRPRSFAGRSRCSCSPMRSAATSRRCSSTRAASRVRGQSTSPRRTASRASRCGAAKSSGRATRASAAAAASTRCSQAPVSAEHEPCRGSRTLTRSRSGGRSLAADLFGDVVERLGDRGRVRAFAPVVGQHRDRAAEAGRVEREILGCALRAQRGGRTLAACTRGAPAASPSARRRPTARGRDGS